MKIVAKMRCQLGGKIYDVGAALDYTGPITSRIAFNFNDASGHALVVGGAPISEGEPEKRTAEEKAGDKIAAVIKTMNREQLMAKLDEQGITYKPTHKTDYLAKLYLQAIGEVD